MRLAQSMEEASVDQLTRVANRGRFERTAQQWIRAHRASGHPFVLALIDVDNFKAINDTFGHPEGDRVLVEIARTLFQNGRPVAGSLDDQGPAAPTCAAPHGRVGL
jgi:diguanylate cyclase (GGDEF)-like protein